MDKRNLAEWLGNKAVHFGKGAAATMLHSWQDLGILPTHLPVMSDNISSSFAALGPKAMV